MALHKIVKGLDLPIPGKPLQVVRGGSPCTQVAVMADDFPGMKASMRVEEGESVKRGQVLFEDRKIPGVLHTAPGAGRVIGIHRGDRRVLHSVVIDLSEGERRGDPAPNDFAEFSSYTGARPDSLSRDQIQALLIESGLWTIRNFLKESGDTLDNLLADVGLGNKLPLVIAKQLAPGEKAGEGNADGSHTPGVAKRFREPSDRIECNSGDCTIT